MPKRTDIHSVLIIGAGPIIIGQACEFDYSGTQACKALKEEGYRVVLVNSNPATIMTDPEFADRTYIEPITPECVEKIIVGEMDEMKKMKATGKLVLLPTLGGHPALNTQMKSVGEAMAIGRTFKESLQKCCLLYTSPSPRDRQKSRMPSSA